MFFSDYQVKQFSHNEKMKWIFTQIFAYLNPVETSEISYRYWSFSQSKDVSVKIPQSTININGIDLLNNLEIPWEGISIHASNDLVTITGSWFRYSFPTEWILYVWKRFKRAL